MTPVATRLSLADLDAALRELDYTPTAETHANIRQRLGFVRERLVWELETMHALPATTPPRTITGNYVNTATSDEMIFAELEYPPENARLIAAAPEMRDALRAFISAFEDGTELEVDYAVEAARAALAKAEGK